MAPAMRGTDLTMIIGLAAGFLTTIGKGRVTQDVHRLLDRCGALARLRALAAAILTMKPRFG